MLETLNDAYVEEHVAETIDLWHRCATQLPGRRERYSSKEQTRREEVYDAALCAVEQEASSLQPGPQEQSHLVQKRIVDRFAQFSSAALGLDDDCIHVLENEFLPVGTQLVRWAREFDPALSMADIIQASRNAWTACGLQPLLGIPIGLTPSIFGYSLLYPYSDNFLDQESVSVRKKLRFSRRFRLLLQGDKLPVATEDERRLKDLIGLIEQEYPRSRYPLVFASLLAIHAAQEESITQLTRHTTRTAHDVLRISCRKGGTSVLADAYLAYGRLSHEEMRFAFEWGVLLQLGDDLQDVKDDLRRGSMTLFSLAAQAGQPLDRLALQLLTLSDKVAQRMDRLPRGSAHFKQLLKMSWKSLIIRAVADAHEYFSDRFVTEAECCSPFRFSFLRARNEKLSGQQGLYELLFDTFLQPADKPRNSSPYSGMTTASHGLS